VPTSFRDREAVRGFLVCGPLAERWKHRPTRANGQLAVGCYLFSPVKHAFVSAVIDVLTLDGEKIAAVTVFLAAEREPTRPVEPTAR
jgi:RNA polymerase sigma-70 factor, ECF subfamily